MMSQTAVPAACSQCGAMVPGGADGCFAQFATLNARAYADPAYGAVHLLCVDAHALQHLEDHDPQIVPFHLARLCWMLEFGGDSGLGQEPRWLGSALSGLESPLRFAPPRTRSTVTIADVMAASPEAYAAQVRQWAQAVWDTWAEHHTWMRAWISARGFVPAEGDQANQA